MAATYTASGWNLSMAVKPAGQSYEYEQDPPGPRGGAGGYHPRQCDHLLHWRTREDDGYWKLNESCVSDAQVNRAAVSLGQKGGLSTSEAKANAARENGRKGGRPPGS